MNNTESAPETSMPRSNITIRSAMKAYALKVSKERRAGKFERVGESFLNECEADLEAVIRSIAGNDISDPVAPDSTASWFITGKATGRVEEKLNEAARRIVQRKVMRHPTLGVTLK